MRIFWLILFSIGVFLSGCSSSAPKPSSADKNATPAFDRVIARYIALGKLDLALKVTDSLLASKEPANREVAAYWKSIVWLYQYEPDSAVALLESYQGKWSGGLRRVHVEAFLRLAKDASVAKMAARHQHDPAAKPVPDRSLQDRIEALQKESGDLRAEKVRLEAEILKYQKLIEDLRTIR
jgi:hypothetical protein